MKWELTKYAMENKLTNTLGWKWTKKFNRVSKRIIKQLIKIHALKTQAEGARRSKFKFSNQVPDNTRHAYLLDKVNVDTK